MIFIGMLNKRLNSETQMVFFKREDQLLGCYSHGQGNYIKVYLHLDYVYIARKKGFFLDK